MSLGDEPHRHMDPEKGDDTTDPPENSDDVVTKAPSESEAQNAIVYPNVFWTSCVSFGVALALFLVSPVQSHALPRSTILTTLSQVGLDMVSAYQHPHLDVVARRLAAEHRAWCLITTPDLSRQLSRPPFPKSLRTSLVSTSSAGTPQLSSSLWLVHSPSGMDLAASTTCIWFSKRASRAVLTAIL